MSYPINQKITPSNQPAMGINAQAPLQNIDADKVQQGLTQNSALKGVTSGEEKNGWLTPAMSIPVFFAMGAGMDKFNKACGGNTYEDSILGKVEAKGQKLGESAFFKSKPMKWLEDAAAKSKEFINRKIIDNSKILTAMRDTPSQPKNKMVLMMKGGTKSEVASDAIQKIEEYLKTSGNKLYTKDGSELSLKLEKEIEELVKDGKIKKGSLKSIEGIKNISHSEAGINEIHEICKANRGAEVDAKRIGKIPKWISKEEKYLSEIPGLKWIGDALGRKVKFAEYANKMEAFNAGRSGHWLAKGLPKAMLRVVEGLTNGTAGGKIAILMAAYFVADAIKKTIDAPKGHGEKGKTFAENLIYNEAMYLTMPLGIKIMHSMGGLQYIGVDKNKLGNDFRPRLEAFNKAVKNGEYTDKAQYKLEKSKIKDLLKPDLGANKTANFFKRFITEPLRAAARFLTVGLENFESFNPKGINKTSGFWEKTGQFFLHGKAKGAKWALGGPLRFIFYMFVIAPPLGKLGAKASHLVFGKPTKSVLDEGKEEETAKKTAPVIMPSQGVQAGQVIKPMQQNSALAQSAPVQSQNLVEMYKPSASAATPVSQKPIAPQEPVRTYIPSSEGVKLKPEKDDKNKLGLKAPDINVAMNRFDNAANSAERYVG